jgi:hypothetical protein
LSSPGVLVPFGQVIGDDVGVGGFEGSAFGFGRGDTATITADLRSGGPGTMPNRMIRILGALCAAFDPQRRSHQARQADAAHKPALLIRGIMFS